MAIIETTRPVPFGAVSIFRVVNFFSNTMGAVAASLGSAKTRKELTTLSNAQLDDIGLMPGDVQTLTHRVTLLH